ncbi:hypothetical protein A8F94_14760 [Bacillus sp. FJAT-27225]|uniref:hypothetical protein n=1 Tax=Bacillus sp. FJAT-27225 TaxID=1743144 RepID=UPI00080C225A|nr:hypothetical protein [Bacillus sp. FJAT-27225]OCA83996.1 hypothetical protein A8F94_14760 [Bacillus sp. FJAT-27225]
MSSLLDEIETINFNRKKTPLMAELRPLYKIALIILTLYLSSNKQSATLLKLQLFNWALKTSKRHHRLLDIKSGANFPIIRFDPSLNRALNFAIAEHLIFFNVNNGKFFLSEKGEQYALSIVGQMDILAEEKAVLLKIKKGISDAYINKVFKERFNS